MAKTKLSIALIKTGVEENNILKETYRFISLEEEKKLYYKVMPPQTPKWVVNFFNNINVDEFEVLKSNSVSAVIIYRVHVDGNGERMFAVCFGFGRNMLNSNAIERRFGLLTVMNSVEPDKFRSIDTNRIESIPINSRTQSSALSDIANFNIDIDKDILKSATGKTSIDGNDSTISGSDFLSVSTDGNYESITPLLQECYRRYKEDRYKINFAWIDIMQDVKDTQLIDSLNEKMLDQLNSEDATDVWISFPDIIDWESPYQIKLRSENLYQDIDINTLKAEYGSLSTIEYLKKKKIFLLVDGSIRYNWPLYKCLYSDVQYNNRQYLLNDAKWYEVDNDLVSKANTYYDEAEISDIEMPNYACVSEKEYNIMASQNEDRFLLDRDLVMYGGSKIEVCDIYTCDKQFIHVKKYNGSAVLSHLFFQGYVSAESLMDSSYRNLVNEKFMKIENEMLRERFLFPIDKIVNSDYEIIFAIAHKDVETGQKPHIPFFSKVSFRNMATKLTNYGFKVKILGLKIIQENNSAN